MLSEECATAGNRSTDPQKAGTSGDIAVKIWPNESVLGTLAEGAPVPLIELPVAPTEPNGQFTVTVPSELPAEYLGESATVDVEVVASDGTSATSYSLSTPVEEVAVDPGTPIDGTAPTDGGVTIAAAGTSTKAEQTHGRPTADGAVHITLDVGAGKARTNRSRALADATAMGVTAADAEGTPGIAPAATFALGNSRSRRGTVTAEGGGCVMNTGATHGPYMEQFAAIYGTAYAKGSVRHEYATTNTVGVGVKYSGSSTWSAGGTQGTSGGFSYQTYPLANTTVSNRVMERYYNYTCYADGRYYTTTYSKPAYIYDGPYFRQISYVGYSYCSTMYSNMDYKRVTGTNGAYSAGLDLPFINLSAQSGWTSTTEATWRSSRTGKICGSNDSWTRASRVSVYA